MSKRKTSPMRPKVHIEEKPGGGVRIRYDVTNVPDADPDEEIRELLAQLDLPSVENAERFKPGSFGARVLSSQRDLVRILAVGVPDVEYLPASDGMLVRGKRHHLVAPHKAGKSMTMLVHACDMIVEGGSSGVLIIDRENGVDEYARRLASIAKAKGYDLDDFVRIVERLHYFEFPAMHLEDGEELAEYLDELGVELVVFDSQRQFLTDFGLKEDVADDYSQFMVEAIEPLFKRGIATLILDNTGHSDKTRGRGTVTKGDINEVLLVMEPVSDFNRTERGSVKLKVQRSRFGSQGEWTMKLGAGFFGSWESAGEGAADRPELRKTVLEILGDGATLGSEPLFKQLKARASCRVSRKAARGLFRLMTADGEIKHSNRGYFIETKR